MPENPAATQFKQASLRIFIGSILATAVVGAIALLIEPDGWWRSLQEKVLETCMTLTGCSFCGLIAGGFYVRGYRSLPTIGMASAGFAGLYSVLGIWELIGDWTWMRLVGTNIILTTSCLGGFINRECYKLGNRRLPIAGITFTSIAALFGVLAVWEFVPFPPSGDTWFFKTCLIATTLAVGCTHLAMLLLMKVHRSYYWVQAAAYYLVLGLAAYISMLIATEGEWIEEMLIIRTVGVWSIAVTAITLILPVLAYLSRSKLDGEGESAAAIEQRIEKLRAELVGLEAQLAALPPAPPSSPWDTPDVPEADGAAV